MTRRSLSIAAAVASLLFSLSAGAEEASRSGDRPTGFAIEVDLAVSSPSLAYDDWFIAPVSLLSPRLTLGAQINRFSVGLQTALAFWGIKDPDADDYAGSVWDLRLGPYFDYEVWTSGRAGLFIGGAILAVIQRVGDGDPDTDDDRGNGFAVDLMFGGRVYVVPQLSIGLEVGSRVEGQFWDFDHGDAPDTEENVILWTLYGALTLRFVASR